MKKAKMNKFIEAIAKMPDEEREKALAKIQAKHEELKKPVGYTPTKTPKHLKYMEGVLKI